MFEQQLVDAAPPEEGAYDTGDWLDGVDWFDGLDGAVPEGVPDAEPWSRCQPSGWLGLDLDTRTVDPGRLDGAELIEAIGGFDHLVSWAAARQARLLAEFATRRPAIEDTSGPLPRRAEAPSPYSEFAADEVGLALRMSRTIAADRLYTAVMLSSELPDTLAAWERGEIDTWKTRAIVEAALLLPDAGRRAALAARVLPRASEQTLSQLRAALRRGVLALDPDGAADRHRRARADRRVVVGPEAEGMASLWALLSAPDATAAYQRLCRLARGLGADDPRGMDARRADLLVDLITGRRCAATGAPEQDDQSDAWCPCGDCDCAGVEAEAEAEDEACSGGNDGPAGDCDTAPAGGTASAAAVGTATSADDDSSTTPPRTGGHRCDAGPGAAKPLIHVIVPITMLMGLDDTPAELVGHGPIPADLAREIASGGTWRRLLTDPQSGTLLDHGRTTYTPPVGLADHVRARDLYCRSPICNQRAATADLDHTIPYPDGPTSQHNLYAGCRHDHRTKTHAPGWHVDQHPDGTVTWTTPTGHSYSSHPHDYRPEPGPDPPAEPAPEPDTDTDTDTDPDPPPF